MCHVPPEVLAEVTSLTYVFQSFPDVFFLRSNSTMKDYSQFNTNITVGAGCPEDTGLSLAEFRSQIKLLKRYRI